MSSKQESLIAALPHASLSSTSFSSPSLSVSFYSLSTSCASPLASSSPSGQNVRRSPPGPKYKHSFFFSFFKVRELHQRFESASWRSVCKVTNSTPTSRNSLVVVPSYRIQMVAKQIQRTAAREGRSAILSPVYCKTIYFLSIDDPISFHTTLFSHTLSAGNEVEEFTGSDHLFSRFGNEGPTIYMWTFQECQKPHPIHLCFFQLLNHVHSA